MILATNTEARAEYDRLCIQATHLLDQAARLAAIKGLSDIERRKAQAAAGLAGVTFHKISIHGADPTDFQEVEKDLRHIARKVEPLIEAICDEANCNAPSRMDDSAFSEVIMTGLENAFSELHLAANRVADDIEYSEHSDYAEHNTHCYALSGAK